jgi:geranylgeranyl reductase family protein
MIPTEVAVVGAGPAGSTAARLLAEQGARVVLFEARRLPREKLCGGGLTPKALPYLAGDAATTIERHVEQIELAGGGIPPLHLRLPEARVAMVQRAPFDYALVEAAARAGVDVRDNWPILRVDASGPEIWLSGAHGRDRAAVVIAADGEPSRIGRRLGIGGDARRRSLALEVDLPFPTVRRFDELQLHFGLPGGYAWYFPKGDHANIGVLSWRPSHQATLRGALVRYAATLGLNAAQGRVKGHWIPQGLRRRSAVQGRVLLVGDAAATGDPFFGEGISYAMASAEIASRAIRAWRDGRIGSLAPYDRLLRAALGPAMRQLSLVAEGSDRIPAAALLALRWSGWIRKGFVEAVAGTSGAFRLPALTPGPL